MFWIVYYLDMVSNLHKLHHAVQSNDYDLLLKALLNILPFFFALDKQNYAR